MTHISHKARPARSSKTGFTLIELLVVVVSIIVITSVLLPALATTNRKSQDARCLNNHRQLALGWSLYSSDNAGRICRTAGLDSLVATTNPTKKYPLNQWCMGTMDSAPSATSQALIMDSLLFKFVGNVEVYRCPADVSTIQGGRVNPYGGAGISRVRSVSMNCWMNPINAWSADNGTGAHPVRNFRALTGVLQPDKTFVTIDENPATINDGWFICDPTSVSWVDVPSALHNGAGNVSFADGHTEMKRWTDPTLLSRDAGIGAVPKDNGVDLRWLQDRSSY